MSGTLVRTRASSPCRAVIYALPTDTRPAGTRSAADRIVSLDKVKARLNRAKAMLREDLKEYMKEQVYAFGLKRCDRIVNGVLAAISRL